MVCRVALEVTGGVIHLTVLCDACRQELLERRVREGQNLRSWTRPFGAGGHCEFCVDEAARAL